MAIRVRGGGAGGGAGWVAGWVGWVGGGVARWVDGAHRQTDRHTKKSKNLPPPYSMHPGIQIRRLGTPPHSDIYMYIYIYMDIFAFVGDGAQMLLRVGTTDFTRKQTTIRAYADRAQVCSRLAFAHARRTGAPKRRDASFVHTPHLHVASTLALTAAMVATHG